MFRAGSGVNSVHAIRCIRHHTGAEEMSLGQFIVFLITFAIVYGAGFLRGLKQGAGFKK